MNLPLKWIALFFFLISFAVHSQSKTSVKSAADSLLQLHAEKGTAGIDLSNAQLKSFSTYFEEQNDTCASSRFNLIWASLLSKKGEYDQALEKSLSALKFFNKDCDSIIYVDALVIEGIIYMELLNYDNAKRQLLLAERLAFSMKGSDLVKIKLYSSLGTLSFFQENFNEALRYYRKGYQLSLDINNESKIQKMSFNVSVAQLMLEEIDSANFFLQTSLVSAYKLNDSIAMGRVYNTLAGVSTDFNTRVAYMDSAVLIALHYRNYSDLHSYYQNLALAYFEERKDSMAFEYSWLSSNYKDSLYKNETAIAVAEMTEKYESEQKSLEIKNLELENKDAELQAQLLQSNQLKLTIGIGALTILLLIAIYLNNQARKTRKILAIKNEAIAAEKERSDELLLNILPYDVAEELKTTGHSKAKSFDDVTILFTDFKEFTKLTEHMPPEELVEEINTCFKAFDEIIVKYGVEKIKTIGDAYMAAGGLQSPRKSNAKDVVLAALEIQKFMIDRRSGKEKTASIHFEMRVGIHTGPVVAGIVGLKKFQYDIWGDTVNTAARMESSSEVSKVNISDFTYQIIKNYPKFSFENRGEIDVKGKGRIKMWFVSMA
jgi:class 3 adenylate cyclase